MKPGDTCRFPSFHVIRFHAVCEVLSAAFKMVLWLISTKISYPEVAYASRSAPKLWAAKLSWTMQFEICSVPISANRPPPLRGRYEAELVLALATTVQLIS